jgi:hypothetical protein
MSHKSFPAAFLLLLALSTTMLAPRVARAQDEPTIAKDSVQVTAWTVSSYKKNFGTWSWVPALKFRVNGPIASGSQLYAEFGYPGAPSWVKFDCPTGEAQPGHWWRTECGGRDVEESGKSTLYTGPVKFAIKMKNELTGTNVTLFTGTAKVAKTHSNSVGPKFANEFVYYVDHDWNLPIAYVYYVPDDVYGWKYPTLGFSFWYRGEPHGAPDPHVFHNGKEVGKMYYEGEEVGKAGCGDDEVQNSTTHFTAESDRYNWTRVGCSFPSLKAWNDTDQSNESSFGKMYVLKENPGDYEIKFLKSGKLVRVASFKVGEDGKLVDNGIASGNKLGTNRIVVPIQVLGDMDGVWNRTAWKTDAFYGNPLNGFTVASAAAPAAGKK